MMDPLYVAETEVSRRRAGRTISLVVRPSRRREMAERAVRERGVSIRLACEIFQVSQSCYRYAPQARAENEEIVQWLLRLTDNHRNWGFGLRFLYLRNVKGFAWNHKRVYRIYRELELNLRIKCQRQVILTRGSEFNRRRHHIAEVKLTHLNAMFSSPIRLQAPPSWRSVRPFACP